MKTSLKKSIVLFENPKGDTVVVPSQKTKKRTFERRKKTKEILQEDVLQKRNDISTNHLKWLVTNNFTLAISDSSTDERSNNQIQFYPAIKLSNGVVIRQFDWINYTAECGNREQLFYGIRKDTWGAYSVMVSANESEKITLAKMTVDKEKTISFFCLPARHEYNTAESHYREYYKKSTEPTPERKKSKYPKNIPVVEIEQKTKKHKPEEKKHDTRDEVI